MSQGGRIQRPGNANSPQDPGELEEEPKYLPSGSRESAHASALRTARATPYRSTIFRKADDTGPAQGEEDEEKKADEQAGAEGEEQEAQGEEQAKGDDEAKEEEKQEDGAETPKIAAKLEGVAPKIFRAKKSGKEKADDIPSWAQGEQMQPGETPVQAADRVMRKRFPDGNYPKGPGSEHNKIKKYFERK